MKRQTNTQIQILDPLLKALELTQRAYSASFSNEAGHLEIKEASINLLVAIAKYSPEWGKALETAIERIEQNLKAPEPKVKPKPKPNLKRVK